MSSDIVIRPEQPADYHETEAMVRRAFWNHEKSGCDEHLLNHKLRRCPSFVPELNFVAVRDGCVVGNIIYSTARVLSPDGKRRELLTFGPLSVLPDCQKTGVGGLLLRHSIARARELGYKGIVIFGHTSYYPRFGFVPARNFGLTTPEDEAPDAFMALELFPGGMAEMAGVLELDPVYFDLPADEVARFDKGFPPL